jgi:glycosyltransferase involved in cell wall biosynthesis
VQLAAECPIRVRLEHTRYRHWGGHSGYPCFIAHLDPRRFQTEKHAAADNHDEIAFWLRPMKPLLRKAIRRRPMDWYKLSDLNAELVAARQCLAGRVDLVHFLDGEHSGRLLPRLLTVIGSQVRTVATFHQPPDLLEDLVDANVLRRFDHIVLMSPSQRSYFEGRVADEKVSVILHGVDTEFFQPARGENTRGPLRCVTAGHWLRDWRVFRSVAAQMQTIEFHVITAHGTSAEDLPNVFRHVDVDDATLASLYRSADILFLPLLDSTANNALLEGMASGLPTITTDLPAVQVYVAGAEAMLAPVSDACTALAALKRLQDDPALRSRMGASARTRAEQLSWPRIARQYEALFSSLVARR